MARKIRLILLFVLLSTVSFSQDSNMHFSGTVIDTAQNRPIKNAVIMAIRLSDAVLLGFTRSDQYGRFELTSVPIDTMELVITHPDFDDKRYYIIGSKENKEINIPSVVLPDKATELDEVVVYANKEPIYFKGDTLVYVADSFARKENAVVEDLLKNLPGIDVDSEGKISSQGREVTKVLVDGDEFFGSDPTIATRNLNADGVKTVEIYETEDETAGGNSEEKIQVMDVRLKDDAKRGYFGKVAGAGGGNPELFQGNPEGTGFYEGELLANYFDSDLKISVFALGANTPNTGFSYQDASRFGLTNEMNTGWQSRLMGNNQRQMGLPTSYKGGFYYSNKISEKTKIGLNYTYNSSSLLVNEDQNAAYFLSDTTFSTQLSKRDNQVQNSHTINFNVDHQLDSLTRIELVSNLTLRDESREEETSTDFLTPSRMLMNQTSVTNNSEATGLEGNINLKLIRDFKKRNRELEAEYQYGYSENERQNFMLSSVNFVAIGFDSITNQQRDIQNKTIGHRALLDFTEPLSRKWKLNFQYKADFFIGNQSNLAFDGANGVYDDFSPVFSNDFNTSRLENRAGASVIYSSRKQTINVGSRIRNVRIENKNNLDNTIFNQNESDVLPFLEYTYKFSNAHRFRLNYSTNSAQPSLNQLQPVRDNTNPNNIQIGNPDLIPNYTHTLNGFYNKWNAIEQSYVWASFFGSLTNNAFSNSISYLPDGTTISQAINVDGVYFGGLYFGGGIPLFNKFLRIDPNANITYFNRNQEIIDSSNPDSPLAAQMNKTENTSYTGGVNFSIRNDTIEVSIGMDYSYSVPKSSLSIGANQPFATQTYKAEVFFELPWRMFIESDAQYIVNTGRADGFDVRPFIWNAKLNKRFTKTGNLVVSLAAYDILNQNIGINRQIMNNVIMDYRTQVIARYFMAGLTYRFNNNKTKEDEGRKRWF